MEATVKQRINEFIETQGLTKSAFERAAKLSNGYLRQLRSEPSRAKLGDIQQAFPDLSMQWLLYGIEPMLKSEMTVADPSSEENRKKYINEIDSLTIAGEPSPNKGGAVEIRSVLEEMRKMTTENHELHKRMEQMVNSASKLMENAVALNIAMNEQFKQMHELYHEMSEAQRDHMERSREYLESLKRDVKRLNDDTEKLRDEVFDKIDLQTKEQEGMYAAGKDEILANCRTVDIDMLFGHKRRRKIEESN